MREEVPTPEMPFIVSANGEQLALASPHSLLRTEHRKSPWALRDPCTPEFKPICLLHIMLSGLNIWRPQI